MPAAAPRDAVAGVVGEARVCDGGDSGAVGGAWRQCGVLGVAHGSGARRAGAGQACGAGGVGRHKRAAARAQRRQRRTGLGLDTRFVQLISADGARICAMRAARRLSAGRAGAACRGRESTAGARGRAGGAHRCKCPKTKTSRRSCPGERHRAQTPSLRPGCSHRREPTRHGAGAAPFLHDEAGPLLAVLLHLHLLIVRHDPPVQTATTRDASVRRTASQVRSRSFCARARSSGRGVRMARGRGSRVCQHARRVWQQTWHLHSALCDMLVS